VGEGIETALTSPRRWDNIGDDACCDSSGEYVSLVVVVVVVVGVGDRGGSDGGDT
jgi:hypothetical protein